MKNFLFSAVFFLAALCADTIATAKGTLGNPELEGNFIVAWFMSQFGSGQWILPFIWIIAAVSISFILWKKSRFLSLLWLNSFAVGHLIGFSTWTAYNLVAPLYGRNLHQNTILFGIFIVSIFVGYSVTWIQLRFSK